MADEVWKEFEQNPVTHSAAHHIMAIAELRESFGYARVSDVARRLNITRGSASLTLKTLKQRGLVAEDENRFLLLSAGGEAIAAAVRGKKYLIDKFLREVLGVGAEDAEIDACKIEHLVSDRTAHQLAKLLRFVASGHAAVGPLLKAWQEFNEPCGQDPENCPACLAECLGSLYEDCPQPAKV